MPAGRIVDREAVVEALKSGQLGGYAGDVWYPQPAPPDHPWRHMPNHAMTPHYRCVGGQRGLKHVWVAGPAYRLGGSGK